MGIDYRSLTKLLKTDGGDLGDITAMHDRTQGSKFFTLWGLPQAYYQLLIKGSDRHRAAFRGATGRLQGFTRCGFGLQTILAEVTAWLGDTMRSSRAKDGLERWFDDILLHNKTLQEHHAPIRGVFQLLVDGALFIITNLSSSRM